MADAKTTFGRRLRIIRKARGMTLEQLGKAAAIGFKHVAAIERGQKTASFDAIDRLSDALKIQPYELFLPNDATDPQFIQSFRRLVRDMDDRSSPALKQLLLTLLPLLRQFEAEAMTNS
jgi:transcriptional regulator with XRE-family HTH domain